jgi:apolipoprotein N-acyltransferase
LYTGDIESKTEDPINKNYRYVWLMIVALLTLFLGGKWNIPAAAWLAPIFAIRFFRDSDRAGRSFLLLWLASAVPSVISWNGATFFPPLAEGAFFLLMTPISLIPYVVDRMYYRRFPGSAWVILVYPVAATAIDFFSSSGSPFGTFGAVAYTQRGVLPIMQIASVAGLWGITFVISGFASLANHIWEQGFKFNRFAVASASVLVLILGLGFVRTLSGQQPAETAQIAGFSLAYGQLGEVMGHLDAGDEAGFRLAVDALHAEELSQIRTLAQQGADIVTLQEAAGMGQTDQVNRLLRNAAVIAKDEGIYIILPVLDLGASPAENRVHILDPNGDMVLSHIKYGGNMFEGTRKGDGVLQTVDTPYGRLSAVICWDADFPSVMKQAGEQDVDLMFVPSNDWLGVKDIHNGMASFRSVENGMSIFRQTGSGVSSVIDPYGRTLQRVDLFEKGSIGTFGAIQMTSTPAASVNTLYPLIGDLVGNMMLATFAGSCIGLLLTRKRRAVQVEDRLVSA